VTWELSLTGLLIGLLVGMTGMGGGSLMTPILVLVFDFNVVLAVGTDILHGAIFKTIGRGGTGCSATCTPGLPFGSPSARCPPPSPAST
jgi:hypothetical protein